MYFIQFIPLFNKFHKIVFSFLPFQRKNGTCLHVKRCANNDQMFTSQETPLTYIQQNNILYEFANKATTWDEFPFISRGLC